MLYHYTIGIRMKNILAEGVIRPATAHVPKGERAVVWFSANPQWEETANKLWDDGSGNLRRLNKEETRNLGDGLYRIAVSPETIDCFRESR